MGSSGFGNFAAGLFLFGEGEMCVYLLGFFGGRFQELGLEGFFLYFHYYG